MTVPAWVKAAKASLGLVGVVVGAFALAMLGSWIAGQCRGNADPVAPPVKPGYVDPGTPAPGPVSESPTAPETAEIAVPQLTRAQVLEIAAKYGLVLTKKGTVPGHQPVSNSPGGSAPTGEPGEGDRAAEGNVESQFPRLFAEEIFGPGPAGDYARVSAWQLQPGGRVDLRTYWEDYQPPPPAVPKRGWLGNEARWEKTLAAGVVVTPDGVGYGPLVGIGYRGWRTGKATWGIDAMATGAQINGETVGVGFVGASVHF